MVALQVSLHSARLVYNMVALQVSVHSARLASRRPLAAPCPRAALRARSATRPHRRVADEALEQVEALQGVCVCASTCSTALEQVEALQFRRGARQDFGRGAASLCWLPAVPCLPAPL